LESKTPQLYHLSFSGDWLEPAIAKIGGLPAVPGIYCVYAAINCMHSIRINRLLYISQADDIQSRVRRHEKWLQWNSQLSPYEEVCFSAAKVYTERDRIEAAMIFQHKPPCNSDHIEGFPFPATAVRLAGTIDLLLPAFSVTNPNKTPAVK
jgi:hypothetical protein